MARESRLDRYLGSFEVTDLTDEDDVRILTQERAKSGSEVQSDLLFHLHLVDAVQVEFNRILGGHDIGFARIQGLQGGIKRVRFTGTGRPSDQNHSIRIRNVPFEFLKA